MGCGCNNCNGTVSQNSQLPPGCDSILSITTDNIGEETIVTITYCSGDTQQFSIPSGVDGAPGQDGADGADGADGINGEQGVQGEVGSSAYIINHVGLDVPSEDNITPTLSAGGSAEVLARSLLPANTWKADEDTVYFDVLVNLTIPDSLQNSGDIFKLLTLQLNPTIGSDTTSGISLKLEGELSKIQFPECTLKFSGEITRRKFTDEVANQSYIALDLIVAGESYSRTRTLSVDNASTGVSGAVSTSNGDKNLAWVVKNTAVNYNVDNYLKIVGDPENWIQATGGPQATVKSAQIYFTTKYLPRNES